MEQDTIQRDVQQMRDLLASMVLEDGLPAAIEAALTPGLVPDIDPVTVQLVAIEVLTSDVAQRMAQEDPFTAGELDPVFLPTEFATSSVSAANVDSAQDVVAHAHGGPASTREVDDGDHELVNSGHEADESAREVPEAHELHEAPESPKTHDVTEAAVAATAQALARFERVVIHAHQVMNQVAAVRAYGMARCARFDAPARVKASAPCLYVEHPAGHRGEFAGDLLGPALELGPYEADSAVDEAVWMTSRTPRLLAAVGAGEGNVATAAAIARELHVANPATCAVVEDAVLRRGVHRRPRSRARRSTRTLVARHEASAARVAAKKSAAQRVGVWLDAHPEPGLSSLTATIGSAEAAALMDAIDQRAQELMHQQPDRRLMGEYRAAALTELALRNVTLTAHVDFVAPLPGAFTSAVTSAGGYACGAAAAAGSDSEWLDVSPPGVPSPRATASAGGWSAVAPALSAQLGSVSSVIPVESASTVATASAAPASIAATAPASTAPASLRTPPRSSVSPRTPSSMSGRTPSVEACEVLASATLVLHRRAGPIAASQIADFFRRHAQRIRRLTTSGLPGRARAAGVEPAPRPGRSSTAPSPGRSPDDVPGIGRPDHPPSDGTRRIPPYGRSPAVGLPRISQSYRPPPSMRDRVRLRDQHCRFPGCDRPARFTDLDHVMAWPQGPTTDGNLQCLCRHHHRAKQSGWDVEMAADGRCRWSSPTGTLHLTEPGLIELVIDLAAVDHAASHPA